MLAVYIVYFQEQSAGNTGFFLHTAVHFSSTIVSWILCFNDVRLLCKFMSAFCLSTFSLSIGFRSQQV
jgi:hypothetical protein